MFQNFPNFQNFWISKSLNFIISKSILKSAVLPASLMPFITQYRGGQMLIHSKSGILRWFCLGENTLSLKYRKTCSNSHSLFLSVYSIFPWSDILDWIGKFRKRKKNPCSASMEDILTMAKMLISRWRLS